MILRDYQIELAEQGKEKLEQYNIAYLALEMRVGKTLISLEICRKMNFKRVLFITKKKAIPSIQKDYNEFAFPFALDVTNYEQVKNISKEVKYDCKIVDEAHSMGAFPKPSQRTQYIKEISTEYLILLSGTPSPESYSQLYHQFWISKHSAFAESNFYKWAKSYVNVKKKNIRGLDINDYSFAIKDKIDGVLNKYFIKFTREEAGFKNDEISEKVIFIENSEGVKTLLKVLLRDKYYKFKDGEEIVCDTAAKLLTKMHQVSSGTVKTETGKTKIFDIAKIKHILTNYPGKKIAIFYKFVGEGELLKKAIPNNTDNFIEFNEQPNKIFISQLISGSMGTNLSSADILIFYNIDFSSVQYWQARSRLNTMNRIKNPVIHWLFAKDGIEQKIYNAVKNKKD